MNVKQKAVIAVGFKMSAPCLPTLFYFSLTQTVLTLARNSGGGYIPLCNFSQGAFDRNEIEVVTQENCLVFTNASPLQHTVQLEKHNFSK